MMRRTLMVILLSCMFLFLPLNLSLADNAEVLPKGVSSLNLEGDFYFPIDEQYGPDGDVRTCSCRF